jgi:hypothetical protein
VHVRRDGAWQTTIATGGVLRLDNVADLPVAGIYAGLLV